MRNKPRKKLEKKLDFGQHFNVKLGLSMLCVVPQNTQIHSIKEKELVFLEGNQPPNCNFPQ